MKIAFLMQCHKSPDQINCLLKALNHPQCDVFIHVDAKSEYIRKSLERNKGVCVLPPKECVDVQWAKFSQVQASLNLLKAATEQGEYSHFF